MKLEYRIIDCAQRSDQWFQARAGVLTASRVGKFLMETTKTARKARESLLCELLADAVPPILLGTSDAPSFETYWMRRGTALEDEAREAYVRLTGALVEQVGFCLHESESFGCSPDALVISQESFHYEGGLEIKCPEPRRHLEYLRAGVLPEQYECQVHASMATTGFDTWDFFSYCPGLPPLFVQVLRSDFTMALKDAMLEFGEELTAARAEIADRWDAWKAKMEATA